MKFDNYEVKFVKGLYDGKRFESLEGYLYSDPQALISSLKKDDKLKASDDLDYFFALPEKNRDGTIKWQINQHSAKSFQIKSLDDVPEDVKNDLISRRDNLLDLLDQASKKTLGKTPSDKEAGEALNRILEKKGSMILVAAWDPSNKKFHPVVVGWGGDFIEQKTPDSALRAKASKGVEPSPGVETGNGEVGDEPENILPDQPTKAWQFPYWIYWALWLLVFILIMIIAYLVLPACGVRNIFSTCDQSISNMSSYEKRIDNLVNQLNFEAEKCENSRSIDTRVNESDLHQNEQDTALSNSIDERLNKSGGTQSDLMVSLVWNTREDLDLKVTCPNERAVNHANRTLSANSCGTLDVDANVSNRGSITNEPIENILLEKFEGLYKIEVRSITNSNSRNDGTNFEIRLVDEKKEKVFSGSIMPAEIKQFTFER